MCVCVCEDGDGDDDEMNVSLRLCKRSGLKRDGGDINKNGILPCLATNLVRYLNLFPNQWKVDADVDNDCFYMVLFSTLKQNRALLSHVTLNESL